MGKYDLIPQTLTELGVEQVFHKVSQRPGKPLWFGASKTKQPVFGLPGNPAAALTCFRRYIRPQLAYAMGLTHPSAPRSREIERRDPVQVFPDLFSPRKSRI